jgi:hypothetical protein
VRPTEEATLEVLARLCERQQELSVRAHLAVMEAFNRFAELATQPCLFRVNPDAGLISELLEQACFSLGALADGERDLTRCLLYAEVRQLVQVAAQS